MLEILSYPFFQRALIAAILVSIVCGIIGTYIVSRRLVFLSGSISHASFGGIGIGYYFGFNPIIGAAVFSILSAFVIETITRQTRMRADSLIGILWSFGMALGIIFIFLTPGYAPNLMSYLFGSILTVSWFDLGAIAAISLAVVAVFSILYREIIYLAFDEEYATTQGLPVRAINFILLSLIALTIVINIRIVGIILVISLLTIPQVTSALFTSDFKNQMWLSIFFALIASCSGLIASYWLEVPSGASIIFTSVIIFILARIAKRIFMKQ